MSKFTFPVKARENLLVEFIDDAEEVALEGDLKPYDAVAFLCMDTFGLGNEEGASRSDGKGDRGIDWYRVSKSSATIYQFKGPQDYARPSFDKKVTPNDLSDLRRIIDYLQTISQKKSVQNRRVRKFQYSINLRLNAAEESEEGTYFFSVNYFVSKEKISDQAEDELKEIQEIAASITEIGSVLVEIKIHLILIDDVLEERWKQQNQQWKTRDGQKEEWVTLEIEDRGIDDGSCTIVFCRGIDLIRAYDDFGHRLFAPNVRCYLQDTPVNSRIKEAVKTVKGIENFRYMNNGVTIIGEAIDKKTAQKLKIRKPGVINGLQTIRALSQSYHDLDPEMKKVFEEKLYLLVRIFAGKKYSFSTDDLIVATNNQNKMEARNLRSNTGTQKHIEQQFAKLGWFYERKERAWEAFSESAGSWDTLRGMKASNFGGNAKANRRNVDNELVAASWQAFSGYSDIARNEKNKIFADDRRYERVFELVPSKHGFEYDYKRDGPVDDPNSLSSIPPASNMLLATLLYSSAKKCASSAAVTRRKFIEKHSLSDLGNDDQNAALANIPEYLAELMMVS
ncbi:MAG: AIPR family protein, partial [Pseudomonadota bacterium]